MASEAASTLLETLPARPPTPPREAPHHEANEVSLKSLLGRPSPRHPRISLNTPPTAISPSSVASTVSVRMGKKVGWSAQPDFKEPPTYEPRDKQLKLTPSSASSRPAKGILKVTSSPNPLASPLSYQLVGSTDEVHITEMLDSTIKQLAGADRESKLDAYMMLARALKTSNNLPDRVALQDKMSLLTQFIQRDILSRNENGLDTTLANQALGLLATFLHFQAIASTITSDFALFIIDHAIRSFEDASLPKEVVRHLMQVVAFQNFGPKVMTLDRVGRLVASLQKIEGHLKGKSIVMSRIQIYKRLVKQSRAHMAVHTDWLKDLLTDMLSNIKDIRSQAIQLGMEAGYSLRAASQLPRKMSEILQTSNEEQTYIEFYIQRLQEMAKDKLRSRIVPQIWSVITMFFRCPLDRWEYYAPWTQLIQSTFNTSDGPTRQEANYAWNRYVFLCLSDSKFSPKLLSVLCQPLMAQLRRKSNPKQSEESQRLRRTVLGGICNLYYYAFRPGVERINPEVIWDLTVQPVISQLSGADTSADDVMQASRILVSLLDVKTPVVWREDRILDLPPVRMDELPSIESRWIRKHSERIMKAVGPVMENKFLDLANKDSLTYRLWDALAGSIAAASSKDIKVSEETARFFALTLGLLARVWSKGYPDSDSLVGKKLLPAVTNYIKILVDTLTLLPFLEKRLSMTIANTFEPVATPSHRPDRARGIVRSPLHHLFVILSAIPPGGVDDEDFATFFLSTFEPFFASKTTSGRMELSRELLRLLPSNAQASFAPWSLCAQATRLSLEGATEAQSDRLLGPEYREIVSLLERGLISHPGLPLQHWSTLFKPLSDRVIETSGDAGRALVIVEPLAKALLESVQSSSVRPSTAEFATARILFEIAKLPRDRQALEAARRRLWGASVVPSKGSSADPFDNLYKLGNALMSACYARIGEFDAATEVSALISQVSDFMMRSFPQAGFAVMVKLQEGMAVWLQDDETRIQAGGESPVSKAISALWDNVCKELTHHAHLDKAQFDQVEMLLTAAFRSKHRAIVSKATETWNIVVKGEENVECSDSLRSIASSIRPRPSDESQGEFGAQTTIFGPSPGAPSFVVLSSAASFDQDPPLPPVEVSQDSARSLRSRKRRPTTTPEVKPTKRANRTSTPRLRHDNSQIQFETIMSSSPVMEESQHLTERQKEVREQQKENANVFREMRSPGVAPVSPVKVKAELNNGGDTTPVQTTSYNELISSTPTPRRGQMIHMEEFNDPPSSPLVPRPCPLISEVRSRSRTKTSLDNWIFSSPAGSPVSRRQQNMVTVEIPKAPSIKDSTKAEVGTVTAAPEVGEEVEPTTSQKRVATRSTINTPVLRRTSRRKAKETPRSSNDQFVDAKSSPGPVSSAREADSKDTSFAFSEGDDSHLMRLVVEIESKSGPPSTINHRSASDDKDEEPDLPVQKELSPVESSMSSFVDVIPSTPAEEGSEASQRASKRKRKRGAKSYENRRKKRKSVGSQEESPVENSQSQLAEVDVVPMPKSPPSLGMRTRRIARQERELIKTSAVAIAQQPTSPEDSAGEKEDGDTDEELLSQLIAESNAASQAHEEPRVEIIGDSMEMESPSDEEPPEEDPAADNDDTEEDKAGDNTKISITDLLQNGLETLRTASLSRDEMYKIEDVLMDLKRELYEAERRGREGS